jgi:curved DNA-binding protein CbpA
VEINEAYNVLSDTVQRKAYDKSRVGKEGNFGDWVHEEEAEEAAGNADPFEKVWALVVGFYPDLVEINNRLTKISKLLAFSFRASLLERKMFEKRKELAEVVEKSFLQSYFGSNQDIVTFANYLICGRKKAAAKALNEAIRVLGSDSPANIIINKICKDFNIETFETEEMREQRLRKECCGKW